MSLLAKLVLYLTLITHVLALSRRGSHCRPRSLPITLLDMLPKTSAQAPAKPVPEDSKSSRMDKIQNMYGFGGFVYPLNVCIPFKGLASGSY